MNKIREIIRNKPPLFVLTAFVYLLLVGIIKWNIHPTTETLIYLAGGVFGIYFLDFAEVLFGVQPSPFRSILFATGLAVVSLFIITSSGSFLACGLVLSLYLTMMLWKIGEWNINKNLNNWYRLIAAPVPVRIQMYFMSGFVIVFLIQTVLFIQIL